jgi:hypothetical protein
MELGRDLAALPENRQCDVPHCVASGIASESSDRRASHRRGAGSCLDLADGPSRFSQVQQKDTNNGMTLQFIQYLDRRTFECRFA